MAVDVAVLGGGVAGLTAGLFAARLGRSTLVLVPDIPGGHLATIDRVEDFLGFPAGIAGYELGPAIHEQAMNAGAEFRMTEATGLRAAGRDWVLSTAEGEVEARAIVVASGSRNRPLGVPGEERLLGHGVSHCASCDGPMLRGKRVIVAGAGDSGLQEALTLAEFAAEVLVLHRSAEPEAQAVYIERARQCATVQLRGHTALEEILGEPTVQSVRVRDIDADEQSVLPTDAVFVYVGLQPNTGFLNRLLELDGAGRIPVDLCMRTAVPGLFAAGDVRSQSASQAVTAAGDGATAAIAAHRYLSEVRKSVTA